MPYMGGMAGMKGRLRREGTDVYLRLIPVVVQKPTQHCEAIILQLKKKENLNFKPTSEIMYLAVKHVKKTSYNDIQVLHYLNTKT